MTMSAQLMAAGANQQLIATQLNTKPVVVPPIAVKVEDAPASAELSVPHPEVEPAPSASLATLPEPASEEKSKEPTGLSAPAPAVELESSGQPNDALEQIRIDKTGYLHDASPSAELARKAEEETKSSSQGSSEPLMHGPEKVIAPLSDTSQPKSANSGYIYEPPANGGTFTGSAMDDAEKEVPASGSGPTSSESTPILSHDKPAASEDSARQAVVDAVSSANYTPVAASPIEALNAQPMNLDPTLGDPADAINPSLEQPSTPKPQKFAPPVIMQPPGPTPPSKDPTDITMPTPG
ncbi:MAG: hypothetical protein AAB624_01035, partial [Patescibacteria group bacterium]